MPAEPCMVRYVVEMGRTVEKEGVVMVVVRRVLRGRTSRGEP